MTLIEQVKQEIKVYRERVPHSIDTMPERVLKLIESLEIATKELDQLGNHRENCTGLECCGQCGEIGSALEALEKINEILKVGEK